VRELLKRQLGEMVRRELPADLSVITSVHDVEVAPDLKSAEVHVGVIAPPDQQRKIIDLLNHNRPLYQSLIARAVVLRHTPRLRFHLDTSVERGNRVIALLDQLEKTDDPPPS
jgi:ribosome-binding factor A